MLIKFLLLLSCLSIYLEAFAQSMPDVSPVHSVYLVGNTAGIEKDLTRLQQFKTHLQVEKNPHTLLFLGDYYEGNNSKEKLTTEEKLVVRTLTNGLNKKQTLFLNGDRDWNNSGKDGEDKIEAFEDFVQKELEFKKAVLPSDACAGPKSVILHDKLALITINSQWLMHPHERPELTNTNCKTLSELDFWDEMEDLLEEIRGKNILIAAHHPVYASGRYSGKKLGYYHLLPIVGTFYHAYRRQIGHPADMAYTKYENFSRKMLALLDSYHSVIYASGHEMDLEIHQIGGNYHLNSGSFSAVKPVGKRDKTLFSAAEKGFMKLEYFAQGQVVLKTFYWKDNEIRLLDQRTLLTSPCGKDELSKLDNQVENLCKEWSKNTDNQVVREYPARSKPFVPGAKFEASKIKRALLGDTYRKEWLTPITLPYLNIQTKYGGLTPFGIGGGGQTFSVLLKGGNGKEYAFRLLEKDPVKNYSETVINTVYGNVVKDMVSGQHPFGVTVVDHLLDNTDILHTQSEFLVMPADAPLGIYKEQFAGKPGVLEIRAKDGFLGSDDIKSTDKMFRKMYKSNKVKVDGAQYIKTRLFDLIIGDFDRHRRNWKWAGFEKGEEMIYEPLPRDRDYAFPILEGIILGTANNFTFNGGHFGAIPRRVGALTFKGRFLDRQIAPQVSWEVWEAAVKYLQTTLTDEVVDEATNQLPVAIQPESGAELAAKIKSRRDYIATTARTFYEQLAKEVDVVGSNKKEIYLVNRLSDGKVHVQMYDEEGEEQLGRLLLDRIFDPLETKEIRLYGLGGKDIFKLRGKSDESILVRIIGGKGDDRIIDDSNVSGLKKLTKVYDTPFRDSVQISSETKLLSPKKEAVYNPLGFAYNSLIPFPKFRVSSGNGFGVELELDFKRMGFNKPQYAHRHQFQFIYYSIEAHRFDVKNRFRHILGLTDIEFHTRVAFDYDQFPFFYGFGNETVRDEELFEEDYYRLGFKTFRHSPYLIRDFWDQSHLRIGLDYQYNEVGMDEEEDASILDEVRYTSLNGLGSQHHLGVFAELDLDFRDHPGFTKKGAQFYLKAAHYKNYSRGREDFGLIDAFIAYYHTLPVLDGLTFVGRVGGIQSYGNAPFYQRASLGSHNYLRSYVRNRFLGDQAVFVNTEARLHLGTINNVVVPLNYGVFGFWEAGRIWLDQEEKDGDFRKSIGGGIYIAPFSEVYSIVLTTGKGEDEDLYYSIRLGLQIQ